MNKIIIFLLIGLSNLVFLSSCGEDDEGNNGATPQPTIYIESTSTVEGDDGLTAISLFIKSNLTVGDEVKVDFITEGGSAIAGDDFESKAGTATISAGSQETAIEILILGDTIAETDEAFKVVLSNAVNADISINSATVTIRNDDVYVPITDVGYETPINYDGYTLVWAEEFEGVELNTSDWNYETGNSGWGNNESQNYQSGSSNVFQTGGKLVIEAREESVGGSDYTSARITTQGKKYFQYGRIDVRAKLPEGQGIWPAIWMLGESFASTGWPACGEIDIMELVGHEPAKVHGTVHWDNQGSYASYGDHIELSSGKFSDEYHVFSIIWDVQAIRWYMDDQLYNTIDISPSALSEFKSSFFFILNVAVGGNWPGYPDDSTVFPQRMEVDYIRVFQQE